jgi:hypothetical protein
VPIAEMVRNQSPFDVLPTWREIVIVSCVGLAVLNGVVPFNREMNVYSGAQITPITGPRDT